MLDQTRRQWLQAVAGSLAGLALPACSRWAGSSDLADVCIVGSGPAGAILACDLANRGVRTLLLEGGPNPATRRRNLPDAAVDLASLTGPVAYPVDSTRFLGDGGTSNLWGGECPRFQPVDFDAANTYAPSENPWPITYEEIEPYYQRAEAELSIAGGAQNRYSPPRASDFSLHLPAEQNAACLQDVLGTGGWSFEPTPTSRTPRVAQSHLPRLAGLPSATFQRGVRVTGIVPGPDGRVSHLEARGAENQPRQIRARFYVLACGGIETPRLLLQSRDSEFPQGIGNAYDQVGRHFMEHLAVELGTFRLPSGSKCAQDQAGISWQFSREFKMLRLGNAVFEFALSPTAALLHVSAVIEMRPSASNRVSISPTDTDAHGDPAADVTLVISDDERRTWEHARTVARRVAASLDAPSVEPASDQFRWCHHHMGTCRMGRDPDTSVVDPALKVHDTDNLYVSGSASFVTCGAGSPTLLLTALGLRLADHLVARVHGTT
jgi:choline dehydrogenase-like flavoprotein